MPELDNPAKQVPIAPRFFLASSKSSQAPELPEALAVPERRAMAASYVTGQDNPWFAKAYINRVWYVLMGEAFYEPIDDIGPEREPRAPEVLNPLAEQWQKGGYDIRWLFRTILNTDAYQRRVRSTANAAGKTPFASSCASRLRADQVFDALVQALATPRRFDRQSRPAGSEKARQRPRSWAGRRHQQGPGLSRGESPSRRRALRTRRPRPPGLASQVGKKAGATMRVGRPQAALRSPLRRRSFRRQ